MESARIYQQTQERLVALSTTLDEVRLSTVVPACPDWDVRQTYAHLSGLSVELLQGLISPPATDGDTARQVAERADMDIDQINTEWTRNGVAVVEFLRAQTRARYFLPALDAWHHENDIRGALGMEAQVQDADRLADFVLGGLARAWPAERPSVRVLATDTGQEWNLGEGSDLTLRASAFELARAMTGRRSIAQILAMDWTGEPADVAPLLPTLPAPEHDLTV